VDAASAINVPQMSLAGDMPPNSGGRYFMKWLWPQNSGAENTQNTRIFSHTHQIAAQTPKKITKLLFK